MNNSWDVYNKLVEDYKKCVKVHFNIDYEDKKSISRGNKAVSDMIQIAKEINNKFPEKISDFCKLLQVRENKTDIWVAHHILEHMSYTKEIEKKAIKLSKNMLESVLRKTWETECG